jgi:hypothetical protein
MEIVTTGGGGGGGGEEGSGFTVTVESADLLKSAWLRPVTVTVMGLLVDGATYKPEEEMIPVRAVPPSTPLTSQATLWSIAPLTTARNRSESPAFRTDAAGDTEIVTIGVGVGMGVGVGDGVGIGVGLGIGVGVGLVVPGTNPADKLLGIVLHPIVNKRLTATTSTQFRYKSLPRLRNHCGERSQGGRWVNPSRRRESTGPIGIKVLRQSLNP